MNVELRNKIVGFLKSIPNMQTEGERQALILGAALDDRLQGQIGFGDPLDTFCQLLISTLTGYGELADGRDPLEAVLVVAKGRVGPNKGEICDALIEEWRASRTDTFASPESPSLEVPTGVVPLDSLFYVERTADHQLQAQLERSGTIATIRGARQTGKTSLLARGVDFAEKLGVPVICLDFQQIFSLSQLNDLESFSKYLAYEIADRANARLSMVDDIWGSPFTPLAKLTRFVERSILTSADRLVLAMDEADMLLKTSFYSDYFGLLRAWHNSRANNELWRRLNLIVVISTDPSLLIDDFRVSPFNVGLRLNLKNFSEEVVRDLNQRHGTPLQSGEIPLAMEFLGGHPYLIRQALYTLVSQGLTWPDLVAIADDESGPFGDHLLYQFRLLGEDPALIKAMRRVVSDEICPESETLLRLSSASLVRIEGDKCVCRYGLYKRFFGKFFRS